MDERPKFPLHDEHVKVRDAHIQKLPREIPYDAINTEGLDQAVNILGYLWAILVGPLENEGTALPVKTIVRSETGKWWVLGQNKVSLGTAGVVDEEVKSKAAIQMTSALRAIGQTDDWGRTSGTLPIFLVTPEGGLHRVDRQLNLPS